MSVLLSAASYRKGGRIFGGSFFSVHSNSHTVFYYERRREKGVWLLPHSSLPPPPVFFIAVEQEGKGNYCKIPPPPPFFFSWEEEGGFCLVVVFLVDRLPLVLLYLKGQVAKEKGTIQTFANEICHPPA